MRRPLLAVAAAALAGALVQPGPARAAVAPTSGLVLSYTFDQDQGTAVRDGAAPALPGTLVGAEPAAAHVPGRAGRGTALDLVGARHQYVAVPERSGIDVDRFTLAALVRYSGVENDRTDGRWEVLEKAGAYWLNVRTDGRVRVGGFFGGCASARWRYLDSTAVVRVGTWTHLAATYDGAALTVWVDGVRAGRKAVSGRTCVNDEPLAVGAKRAPAKGLLEAFWDGQLDDVRVYRRALSATEIRQLVPA